jgi:hypothetical protein
MPPRARLAWSWTLVILVLCWIPRFVIGASERIPKPFFVPNLDKMIHMGIFAVFAFLWMRVGSSGRRAWWVFAAGVALAVITELGQMVPIVNRDCSIGDGVADSLGVIAGLVAYGLAWKLAQKQAVRAEV